jgi:holo-[acyl-carrier protein] synthase
MILGVGTDLVHVPGFGEQLTQEGSTFTGVFTDRERRDATGPTPIATTASLAARWAAKESFIKAWSQALWGTAPPIAPDRVKWSEIEIIRDRWHRPRIRLIGEVAADFKRTCPEARIHVSLSHDGDYAQATVILEGAQDA